MDPLGKTLSNSVSPNLLKSQAKHQGHGEDSVVGSGQDRAERHETWAELAALRSKSCK